MATTTWDDVYMGVQAKCLVAEKHFQMRLHVEDADNYALFSVWPNTVPHIPCGTWEIHQVIGGISLLIDSGNLDQFDLDVYYMWRFLFRREGANVVYQAYQDENLLTSQSVVDTWTLSVGTIGLAVESGGEVHVNKIKVSDVPMPNDYIGPS